MAQPISSKADLLERLDAAWNTQNQAAFIELRNELRQSNPALWPDNRPEAEKPTPRPRYMTR